MKKFCFLCSFLLFFFNAAKAQDLSDLVNDAADDMIEQENENSQSEEKAVENDSVEEAIEEYSAGNITVKVPETDDLIDDFEDYETEVDPNVSLTENLARSSKNDRNDSPESESDNSSNNWVDKLILSNSDGNSKKNSDSSLSQMVENAKNEPMNNRSNAAVFDISGVMLRMTLVQAEDALYKRGYKKVSQKLEIPNFIKWRNEEICRGQGVVGYERLANCVMQKAKKEKYEYVETSQYAKYDTKESIILKLTSTFTNNKIYKITYKSESVFVRGSSQKAAYLRNIKIFDFWKKINQKYGAPDNRDDVLWGMGGNKPYMKAATGVLLLEDPMLRELDYTRMSREDQRFMNTNLYTF